MTSKQRAVLVVAILASFVAFLDGSVITVALPAIAKEFGGGLALQQWVVDAYLITLGALMLTAGSLSDLFGRKKVLIWGLAGFALTSLLCALAPTGTFLIVSRALQGIAGALLVPSSLALVISHFSGASQGRAIGSWTAWTGIAFLIGPLLGGFLVDSSSWRLIFAINVLPIALTLWLLAKVKEKKPVKTSTVDLIGSVLATLGLGGPVFALIEQGNYGWTNPFVLASFVLGLIFFALFLWHEKRAQQPMLPLNLFAIRNFAVGNIATISVYAGLSVATFLIAIFVQQVGHYSALEAGMALVPVTIIMFLLSKRFGALAGIYGPRFFMSFGPITAALGFLTMLWIDPAVTYWLLLPGIILFGIGLSITVAPLTSAILGSIPRQQAGIGSAVNNAVARIAGLLAIACLGLVTGQVVTVEGFQHGVILTAALLIVGGVISLLGIRNGRINRVNE